MNTHFLAISPTAVNASRRFLGCQDTLVTPKRGIRAFKAELMAFTKQVKTIFGGSNNV